MAGKSAIRHTLGERIFDTFNVVLMIFFWRSSACTR